MVAFAPHLGAEDLSRGLSAGHRAALDGTLSAARAGHAAFVAIRLWSASGEAIRADDPAVVGTVHPPAEEFGEALAGSVASEVFDAQSADRPSGTHGRLLEVYVPLIYAGKSEPAGVFEMYLPYAPVAAAISANQRRVHGVLGGGLVALYLVLLPIVASASRRLRRQAADNRRLAERHQDRQVLRPGHGRSRRRRRDRAVGDRPRAQPRAHRGRRRGRDGSRVAGPRRPRLRPRPGRGTCSAGPFPPAVPASCFRAGPVGPPVWARLRTSGAEPGCCPGPAPPPRPATCAEPAPRPPSEPAPAPGRVPPPRFPRARGRG
jgi:hypothetical protein